MGIKCPKTESLALQSKNIDVYLIVSKITLLCYDKGDSIPTRRSIKLTLCSLGYRRVEKLINCIRN